MKAPRIEPRVRFFNPKRFEGDAEIWLLQITPKQRCSKKVDLKSPLKFLSFANQVTYNAPIGFHCSSHLPHEYATLGEVVEPPCTAEPQPQPPTQ
uniref:Uncharacterized protein n=1 Tax=Cucumis melo TaxID=3656 RepID=A0A9I9EGH2_CUCME